MIPEGIYKATASRMRFTKDKKDFDCAEVRCLVVDDNAKTHVINKQLFINDKQVDYTKRDLKLVGWKGGSFVDAPVDIAEAYKGGLQFMVEIKHVQWTDRNGNPSPFPVVHRFLKDDADKALSQDAIRELDAIWNKGAKPLTNDDVPPIDDDNIPF